MTEQQAYDVISRHGDVEVRRYVPCTIAEVVVEGSVDGAGSAAFAPLASYIGGRNDGGRRLAMTAPVLQSAAGPDQAPAIVQRVGSDRWSVGFVLPGSHDIAQYPAPTDARVTLRQCPQEWAAAVRWSGRWSEANVAKRTEQLMAAVATAGWHDLGDPRWARYDPPWKPAFARRNEILVPIAEPG